jgi:hypothetical protein
MRKLKTKDMKQIKSKKTMLGGLRLLAVAVLTLVSLVVKADEKRVQVDINTFENGTVVEKSQSKTRSYLTIGGANTTAIDAPITHLSPLTSRYSGAWFSLDGRRLSTAPASKGIYIHNGKKVVIK